MHNGTYLLTYLLKTVNAVLLAADTGRRELKTSGLRSGSGLEDRDIRSGSSGRGTGGGISGGGGGESVKREVQTETIGQGPNAVTRTTTIETRTTQDGRTHTTRTVKETRGASQTFNDATDEVRCTLCLVDQIWDL